jgi:hypothetical protein
VAGGVWRSGKSPLVMGGLAQTLASSETESGARPVRLAARIGSFPVVRQESGFATGAGDGPCSPSMACRLNLPGFKTEMRHPGVAK